MHELLDYEASHEGESFGSALSMVYGLFLASIQLIQVPILLDKGNEMSLHLSLHLALPFLHRLLVLLADVLVHFEGSSDFSRSLSEVVLCKFGQI